MIQFTLEQKVILKRLAHKSIYYFSQYTDIFLKVAGFGPGNYIYFWKSKGLSDESITALTTSDYSLNPQLRYLGNKTRVEFERSCLKQDQITYTYRKIVNIYIVYKINKNYNISSYLTLENCLFAAASLTKKC